MDKMISCEFNIDTARVEVKYADGSVISIDCTLVEAEVARNMYESSELEWLVYNAPVDYVNLLLHGDFREYLKIVTTIYLRTNTIPRCSCCTLVFIYTLDAKLNFWNKC